MNPTSPAAATVPAASSAAATYTVSDTRATRTPRPAAVSSPSASTSMRAREGEQHTDADRDVHREHAHLRPARVADGAHHPPQRAAHDVVLRVRERHHDRGVGERADHDAGHEHHARIALPARRARDEQRERDRAERAGEPRERYDRGGCMKRDGEHRAHRRAAGDAEQVRLGEPVSRRALQRGAGCAKPGADERGEHDARQAQRAHHRDFDGRAFAQQAPQHVRREADAMFRASRRRSTPATSAMRSAVHQRAVISPHGVRVQQQRDRARGLAKSRARSEDQGRIDGEETSFANGAQGTPPRHRRDSASREAGCRRITSGSRLRRSSTVMRGEGAVMKPYTLRPPAISISSLRKLPPPTASSG